jgi:hypothetical protein
VCARQGRPAWRTALRRARQNIDSAVRLIDRGYAGLEEVETCPPGRRLVSIARRLLFMPRLLDLAHEKLARAARRLREANESLVSDPRGIGEAPAAMLRQTIRLIETGLRVEQLSSDAGVTFARMRRVLEATAAAVEALGVEPDEPLTIEVPKTDWRRRFLRHRRRCTSDRLRSLRRRRRSPVRATDAPRRICRGRAPPTSLICQL